MGNRTLVVLFGFASLVAGGSCSSPGGNAQDGGMELDAGVPSGPPALLASAYRHISDSDGAKTVEGGESWMAFHASGAVFLP